MKARVPLLLSAVFACATQPVHDPSSLPPGQDVVPDVVQATRDIAPIRGGGMTALADGRMATVDVDSDRIVLFDPATLSSVGTIDLEVGSQPFRLESAGGNIVASLRGTHTIAAFDAQTGEPQWATQACIEPRGIESDGQGGLFVVCHSGEVVVLDGQTGDVLQNHRLGWNRNDLRDVVFDGEDLWVTRFRSAKVLRLDPGSLEVLDVFEIDPLTHLNASFAMGEPHTMDAAVAWRAVARPEGGLIVLHQRAERRNIDISRGTPAEPGGSAYGGKSEPQFDHCMGILHTTWTEFDRSGALTQGPVVKAPAMATDMALSAQGELLLSSAPAPHSVGTGISRTFPRQPVEEAECLTGGRHQTETPGQVVAVGWSYGKRVVQTRQPFAIQVDDQPVAVAAIEDDLPIDPLQLPGWAMFHETTPSGISCASCHPEGLDDGHVWTFEREADQPLVRRTPGFGGVVSTTSPYHWDGEFRTLVELLDDVFVRRMGASPDAVPDASALAVWMDTVTPPLSDIAVLDAEQVQRGRQLFEDDGNACATCHYGAEFTNNMSFDVGTGGRFQVPTLLGIAGRGPWMHTGCAKTLEQRFDPECGGADHGGDHVLTQPEIADLVAYLRTL